MTDGEIVGPTADDVARWMVETVKSKGEIYQMDAADEIPKRFGADFIYLNGNGNPAIRKDVLKSFGKLGGNEIVWANAWKGWRLRRPDDEPGRRQPA